MSVKSTRQHRNVARYIREGAAVLSVLLALYSLVEWVTHEPPPEPPAVNDTGWRLVHTPVASWADYLRSHASPGPTRVLALGLDADTGAAPLLDGRQSWETTSIEIRTTLSNYDYNLAVQPSSSPSRWITVVAGAIAAQINARVNPGAQQTPSILLGAADSAWLRAHLQMDSTRRALRDKLLTSLDSGIIAFNAPERMKRSDPVGIHLVLDPRLRPGEEARAKSLVEETVGPAVAAHIAVGPAMRARLVGPSFKIDTVTPTQQNTGNTTRTEWRWIVIPNERGKHRLDLTLDAILEGEPSPFAIRTFSRTIEVEVSAPARFFGWINGQLEWIGPALLSACIGIFAWLSGRRHGRLNPSAASEAITSKSSRDNQGSRGNEPRQPAGAVTTANTTGNLKKGGKGPGRQRRS